MKNQNCLISHARRKKLEAQGFTGYSDEELNARTFGFRFATGYAPCLLARVYYLLIFLYWFFLLKWLCSVPFCPIIRLIISTMSRLATSRVKRNLTRIRLNGNLLVALPRFGWQA